MKLTVAGVEVQIDGHHIVRGADLVAAPGELVGLVGPNGCGKSTLLRSIYRVLRPVAGLITLGDQDLWGLPARQAAQRTAVVAQEAPTEFDFTVEEVVAMGRSPHKRPFERDNEQDRQLCRRSLERVGMGAAGARDFATLSGGEKQRVLLARALAQQTALLLLDEPTNHLDIRYQLEVFALVRGLGVTTVAAVHDLNLAAAYCDRIYVMQAGQLVAEGPPDGVLTPGLIAEVFGVAAARWRDPATGRVHLAFEHLQPAGLPEQGGEKHMEATR